MAVLADPRVVVFLLGLGQVLGEMACNGVVRAHSLLWSSFTAWLAVHEVAGAAGVAAEVAEVFLRRKPWGLGLGFTAGGRVCRSARIEIVGRTAAQPGTTSTGQMAIVLPPTLAVTKRQPPPMQPMACDKLSPGTAQAYWADAHVMRPAHERVS